MARDIAMLPAHNLVVPASEPLVAMFRQSRDDPSEFTRHLRTALLITAIVVIPIVTLLITLPNLFVSVLLGDRWAESAPMLRVLSLLLLYFSFYTIYEKAMIAIGRVRALFVIDLFGLLVIVCGLLTVMESTPVGIGLVRGLAGALNLAVIIMFVGGLMSNHATVPFIGIGSIAVTSAASATVAAQSVLLFDGVSPVLLLVIAGTGFAGTYLFGLWMLVRVQSRSEIALALVALTQRLTPRQENTALGSSSSTRD